MVKQEEDQTPVEIIERLLREGKAQVKVLESPDKWFGVTYMEDKEAVIKEIKELVDKGLIMGFLDFDAECEKSYCHITLSGESNNPEKVREVIFRGINKLKETGLKKEEITRLKKAYHGRFIKQFDHITSVAHAFLTNAFNNIGIFDYVDVIEEISVEDINRRLRENFSENLSVLSVIEPK